MLTKHYPRINKVLVSSFFGDLKQCFYFAPLIVISLYVYMGLRSTMIFPLDMELLKFERPLWHLFLIRVGMITFFSPYLFV